MGSNMIPQEDAETIEVIILSFIEGYESLDNQLDEMLGEFGIRQSSDDKKIETIKLLACLNKMTRKKYHGIINQVLSKRLYFLTGGKDWL